MGVSSWVDLMGLLTQKAWKSNWVVQNSQMGIDLEQLRQADLVLWVVFVCDFLWGL